MPLLGGRSLVGRYNCRDDLLNIPGLNGGTLQVIDTHTGEVLKILDLASQHSLMPEAIESAFGHGADLHH